MAHGRAIASGQRAGECHPAGRTRQDAGIRRAGARHEPHRAAQRRRPVLPHAGVRRTGPDRRGGHDRGGAPLLARLEQRVAPLVARRGGGASRVPADPARPARAVRPHPRTGGRFLDTPAPARHLAAPPSW